MTQTTSIDRQSKAEPDYATTTDGRIVAAPTGEDDVGPGTCYGQTGHGPRYGKRVRSVSLADSGEHQWVFKADTNAKLTLNVRYTNGLTDTVKVPVDNSGRAVLNIGTSDVTPATIEVAISIDKDAAWDWYVKQRGMSFDEEREYYRQEHLKQQAGEPSIYDECTFPPEELAAKMVAFRIARMEEDGYVFTEDEKQEMLRQMVEVVTRAL